MPPASRKGASPKPSRPTTPSKKDNDDKKSGLGAYYKTLVSRRPVLMGIVQGGVISGFSNVTQQLFFGSEPFSMGPVYKQIFIAVACIGPVISLWLKILFSFKLHWVTATCVDQFLFSPVFNAYIFFFISAFLGGGLSVTLPDFSSSTYNLTFSLVPSAFPSIFAFEPIWKTQRAAYPVWLPATLLREKVVPPHLAGLFNNMVAFIWNIIFAMILASSSS